MNSNHSILIMGDRGMLAHAIKAQLRSRKLNFAGVDLPDCDITNADSVAAAFERLRPSLVINCAAFTNVDACESKSDLANAVNGTGVGNLATAAKRFDAKLIHFSTDYVFDGTLRRPLRVNDAVSPQSAYGRSKLLGEQAIQIINPPGWTIIRTAWLFGPNGPNFPQAMLNAAKAEKPLRVVGDQVGAPTFTVDLAAAMLRLIDHNASGIWHIANSGATNWFEFAKAIFAEFKVTPTSFEQISSEQWKHIKPDSAIRPAYSVYDLSPYEKLTGLSMPDWREGLRRYRQLFEGAEE